MKNLRLILAIIAIIALPFFSNAQNFLYKITYSGRVSSPGAIGALRVTTSNGETHDYTTYPSTYDFSSAFTSLTFDFSHGMHPGWGNTYYLVTISKSTLDAQAQNSTVNYYMPNTNRYYRITKGYGYSVKNLFGTTSYIPLDIKVREPYL